MGDDTDERLIGMAFDAGKWLAQELFNAIKSGREEQWRPLVEILPADMSLQARMMAEEEKTRRELEEALGAGGSGEGDGG